MFPTQAHDPTDHLFASNVCACQLELCKLEWEPAKKVEHAALALVAAARCVGLKPSWAKGFLRKASAEAELLAAVETFEKRKAERKEPLDYDDKPWPEPPAVLMPSVEAASHASVEASCRAGLVLERGNAALRLRCVDTTRSWKYPATPCVPCCNPMPLGCNPM